MTRVDIAPLEKEIGYSFTDKSLLRTALTHSSYVYNAHHDGETVSDNERLEFLGDAVLELCISEHLFKHYRTMNEGVMSRVRAKTVCEAALFTAAKKCGLDEYIMIGDCEERSGGRDKPSILSDALEAVIGAMYLDGGLTPARKFIMSFANVDATSANPETKDFKTRLQEYAQARHMGEVKYTVIDTQGPDHKLVFTISVSINGKEYGVGSGVNKQQAGQAAAKAALSSLEK